MSFLSNLFGSSNAVDFDALVEQGARIIDVRTPQEFKNGHVSGSVNIPLNTIGSKVKKLSKENKAIILVCASGARSGQATRTLKAGGIEEVYNGGSWTRFR